MLRTIFLQKRKNRRIWTYALGQCYHWILNIIDIFDLIFEDVKKIYYQFLAFPTFFFFISNGFFIKFSPPIFEGTILFSLNDG